MHSTSGATGATTEDPDTARGRNLAAARDASPLPDRPLFTNYVDGAKALGISVASMKRAVADGTIPHRKIGRRVLIPVAALDAMAAETLEGAS